MEKILELKKTLGLLSEKMIELKKDLAYMTTCIQEKKFIETEVSGRVIAGLLEINNLSEESKKQYIDIGLSDEMPNDIEKIEETLTQLVEDVERKVRLDKYKRFMLLETDDADTKALLDAKKSDMQKILDNYTVSREHELEPYGKFVEAINEKDSTRVVSLIFELIRDFDNELLEKAIVMKTIKEPEFESADFTVHIDVDKENLNTKIIEEKEQEAKITIDEINISDEQSTEIEEKKEESCEQREVAERGLILTNEIFDKDFYLQTSEWENKKVGAKIFIKDIKTTNPLSNAMTFICANKYNSVTAEMVACIFELSLTSVLQALAYLYSKGYVRKYGVEGIGYFYCISPRGYKVLQMKEARNFLKIKGNVDIDSDETIEDTLNPVLTRITYTKLFERYLEELGDDCGATSKVVLREAFLCRIWREHEDKAYVFTGAFFRDGAEASQYVEMIRDNYLDEDENEHFMIAGINRKFAILLAEYLVEKLEINKEKVYCYSLTDDKYYKLDSEMKVDFIELFDMKAEVSEKQTTEKVVEVSKEQTVEEVLEVLEKQSIEDDEEVLEEHAAEEVVVVWEEEKVSEERNIEEVLETSEEQNVEEKHKEKSEKKIVEEIKKVDEKKIIEEEKSENREMKSGIDVETVMKNAYQMIINGKIYCATTYLRSMLDEDDTILQTYERIAYAVNAPWMRCSYNSQKIFTLYSAGEDTFTKYLMVSASLRNFFMNHVGYDYSIKSLHANVTSIPLVSDSVALTGVIYSLVTFKENVHKGADAYAGYRAKDKMVINKELDILASQAKSYYDSYVIGQPRNHKNVKRFVTTWKMIFANNDDLANYLKAIIDKDYEMAELLSDYLTETFISDNCSLEYSNLDKTKLEKFIDSHWDRANTGHQYKTSTLMSDLRNNLINAIEKVLKLMCNWLVLVEATGNLVDDEGSKRYMTMKKSLLEDLENAARDIVGRRTTMNEEEAAGAFVLKSTIDELIDRIEGNYDDSKNKYYYIDFLRGKEVLLDDEYLPDMRGKFTDFEELSLSNRILRHSQADLMSFEKKLEDIFNNYGDDYGTAGLIMRYLEEVEGVSYAEKYNIRKSVEQAEADAKIKLDDFIENLELAQSCGQIEETKENKKEKMQKIANEWFEYARESKNYGFFNMVLAQYRNKIHEDAKVRGKALSKELAEIKEQGGIDANRQKRIDRIQEMIDAQNYTVAEDLLSRINIDELDEEVEVSNTDYLQKFIDEYDYNYKIVANSSRKLSDLVNPRIHNKDDKGAKRLIDNWMINGQAIGQRKLTLLLDALGFTGAEVKEQPKIGKIENYFVSIRETEGRKRNYKHPIAAFGSKASEDGFRVVCLFGKYDADRLIEEFKNIAGTKNTLVLLDYALPLFDRRRLARKIKSDLNDKVFAVLDRVLLMFLVNNYSVQFINQILMYAMMPFSYCQPYVWDSSKVMPPEIFMGRKDELEKIESPAGVNIVYGGRQLGKSALLKMAKMNIDNDENHDRAVFVEIKGLNYERAAKKIGHELYDAGILSQDIDTTDWDELSRVIKRRLQDDKLPYIPYLLLLLDEADTFIESCEEVNFQPFDALKDIQSVGMDRFKFVIAGLHNIVRFKRDAALSNNSVLTHLTSITIKPFDKREAKQLLEEPLYYLGLRFPKDKQSLVSLILANTNYFPGLIQLYCANLIESMRKNDYAGYEQINTPVYEVNPNHIKKVLSDSHFMNQIREKFEITLKLDEDNMYHIIALLMAYLYHQNANSASESEGFSAKDIIGAAKDYGVKKIVVQSEVVINGLMQELLELNILRQTVNDLYLFSRYSFFQMMGTSSEVEDKLEQYMED